jgi:cytoskeletal protein CcmA (bactofilin family)
MSEPRSSNSAAASGQRTVFGRSVAVQGQITASEDIVIEGQFDGTITLPEHSVTVGPEGQVKAEIRARLVVVQGSVTGNIEAREKIDIRRTGQVIGDLVAAAVAIEDGAYFKGSIDIARAEAATSSAAYASD